MEKTELRPDEIYSYRILEWARTNPTAMQALIDGKAAVVPIGCIDSLHKGIAEPDIHNFMYILPYQLRLDHSTGKEISTCKFCGKDTHSGGCAVTGTGKHYPTGKE